jgi:hypothetical protein
MSKTAAKFYSSKADGESRFGFARKNGFKLGYGQAYARFSKTIDGVLVEFVPVDLKFGKGYRVFARGGMMSAIGLADALLQAKEMLRMQDGR